MVDAITRNFSKGCFPVITLSVLVDIDVTTIPDSKGHYTVTHTSGMPIWSGACGTVCPAAAPGDRSPPAFGTGFCRIAKVFLPFFVFQ